MVKITIQAINCVHKKINISEQQYKPTECKKRKNSRNFSHI